MKVSLFIPCLVDFAACDTAAAMLRLFDRIGVEYVYDKRQTCCGQAPFNAGFTSEAAMLAERFLRLFQNSEYIVAPSGSCVSMVKNHYAEVNISPRYRVIWKSLRNRIFELTQFIDEVIKSDDLGACFPYKTGVHNSCHALRELGIKNQPVKLLRKVEGLRLVEDLWEDDCCGFGGAFSAKYPALAGRIAERRINSFDGKNLDYITGVDDSCLMHLQKAIDKRTMPLKTIHIARILGSDRGKSFTGKD